MMWLRVDGDALDKSDVTSLYPAQFRPQATADLVRVGAPYDGGYVVPERVLQHTKGLLSFGLNDEWSFEEEFARRSGANVVCFDPSVTPSFWAGRVLAGLVRGLTRLDAQRLRRGFRVLDYRRFFDGVRHRHVTAAIGSVKNALGLREAMDIAALAAPVFLKMDIEGWEYRVLPELVAARESFSGMAIEFHDVDLHEGRIVAFIAAIADRHVLVHFHVNSHTAVLRNGGALVVEMTFMNRNLLAPHETLIRKTLPIPGLDWPNLQHEQEAAVSFAEFA